MERVTRVTEEPTICDVCADQPNIADGYTITKNGIIHPCMQCAINYFHFYDDFVFALYRHRGNTVRLAPYCRFNALMIILQLQILEGSN